MQMNVVIYAPPITKGVFEERVRRGTGPDNLDLRQFNDWLLAFSKLRRKYRDATASAGEVFRKLLGVNLHTSELVVEATGDN
jgi:hypothetical protein